EVCRLRRGVGAGNERDHTDEWNCGSCHFHLLVIFAQDYPGMTNKITRAFRRKLTRILAILTDSATWQPSSRRQDLRPESISLRHLRDALAVEPNFADAF